MILPRRGVKSAERGLAEELLFYGESVSLWEDERVLERDGGEGCTTMKMHLIALNCAPKNG